MKKRVFKFLLISVFCGFYAFVATAATSLFSDYGQIQNVQNYSSNPFWSPNSPYNQLPQPVYVQGADLNTDDCVKVVQPLVAVQCAARDNCKNTTLADIRPVIMVQLSNLPGHNYVSACSGFIDGIFDSYVAQYGNSIPNRQIAFPDATVPNPTVNNVPMPTANAPSPTPQIQNPYKQTTPQWQQEMDERSRELEELQRQNSAGNNQLSATAFPTTYDDLSFSEKMGLLQDSYEPYKDLDAYVELGNVLSEDEYCSSHINAQGCEKYKARVEQAKTDTNKPTEESKPGPSTSKRKVFKI